MAIWQVKSGWDSSGLGRVSLIKKIVESRVGSGQSDPGRVGFWDEYYRGFFPDFWSFRVGSGFGFLVAQVIPGFE
jgi:hypothetical protein